MPNDVLIICELSQRCHLKSLRMMMDLSISLIICVCFRLFGHTGACSACGQSIPPSEMVMRAQGNVYHLKVSLLASWQKKVFTAFSLTSVWSVLMTC